jgi:hypothetical protein
MMNKKPNFMLRRPYDNFVNCALCGRHSAVGLVNAAGL